MTGFRNILTAAVPIAVSLAALSMISTAPAASGWADARPVVADAARPAALERPEALSIPRSNHLGASELARTRDGLVRVIVESGDRATSTAAVLRAGGRVERSWGDLVQVAVPARSLGALSRSDAVDVRAPARMFEDTIAGESVAASLATAWHAKGFTGKGVKVAVIDGGFAGLAERQAEGELPTNVVTGDYCGGHLSDASRHGTAVAEIVHEMAPDAQLYLLCVDTEVDLAVAAQYATSQGVQVVNHSASWFMPTRGDGSGPIGDIVRAARASGILWVNSAGNYADSHWSGTYNDPDGNGAHDWSPDGDEGNSFVVPDGEAICGVLKWDEWPAGISDFDLGLFESGTNRLLAGSGEYQNGSTPPFEGTCWGQETGADVRVFWAILGYDVKTSPRLDLFSYSPPLQYSTAAGSMLDPAVSAEVLTVGALCWQSRQLEWYSSQGPTIDGRMKPELVGHDSVSGATYGAFSSCPSAFAGTSASSPEVAGAAALVEQAYPAYGPAELEQYLVRNARDLAPSGADNATGAGELTLPQPPDVVAPTATALVSTGRAGRALRLLSRVEDDSGEVRLVGQVKRNGRVVASLKRDYVRASGPTTVSLAWKAPAAGAGSYQHCIRVIDRAGNSSQQSCARIVLKATQE
jgi:subtilisin family serine protease